MITLRCPDLATAALRVWWLAALSPRAMSRSLQHENGSIREPEVDALS
jgi:hypothetical protein